MPDELPARSSMFVVNTPNERRLTATKDPGAIWPSLQACRFFVCEPAAGTMPSHTSQRLESEREKAEIAWNRHLKNLPALQHGKNVMPFGSSPVIPEFPKPTADKSGREQRIKAGAASCREVTDKRR